ncbi:3-hydroxyacyl-CoA dehydrogenase NAD-binding domain-containing protein [Caballeronia novacaledonica]|uniref:3-hydroxybutyryl-CoA dehydrogenase n=1 Tax=Caballeronia novacaledonica TaxID=1544861 RepID=A0AA37IBQ2_9BURK|nr:3-hydroxyacyl-CoA dehydrogenase NAD-binding domain-containing protein [Caballeronia novacaledonica]GJH27006.1 3-hydroxybutyryl-CoA dehydrogenase [Caballeronia novacaledonica]
MSSNIVGIVGTGAMGSGIAQVAAISGRNVVAVDVSASALEKAQATIRQSLSRMVKKESISQEDADSAFSRISFSTKYEALSPADVIIEAATETLDLKRKILRDISRVAAEGTLIATNTSSLSVTALANEVQHPESFVGIHFFNPVPMMPLVEVVRGLATSDDASERASAFAQELGKTPVVVKNAPGFVVNRILVPMMNEAFFVLGEGIASAEEIDVGMKLGANHPIGPLALADMVGLDVLLLVVNILQTDTGDSKYRAAPLLREMVAAGQLGRKTGQGVYKYD